MPIPGWDDNQQTPARCWKYGFVIRPSSTHTHTHTHTQPCHRNRHNIMYRTVPSVLHRLFNCFLTTIKYQIRWKTYKPVKNSQGEANGWPLIHSIIELKTSATQTHLPKHLSESTYRFTTESIQTSYRCWSFFIDQEPCFVTCLHSICSAPNFVSEFIGKYSTTRVPR